MSGIDVLPGLRTYTTEDVARANALGPGRLYSLAEAQAMEAVVAAARVYRAGFPYVEDAALIDALAGLDRLEIAREA